MSNAKEVEDFNLFTSPLDHPVFMGNRMDAMNELTKRLDNLASVLIESTQYSQYCPLVYEASAKLEAAERLRDDLMQIMSPTVNNMGEAANQAHRVAMALAAYDKEQK